MLDNYAVRITHPYESVARIVKLWSSYAKRIAVYEHDDDGAKNIHCHLHLEDVAVTSKRLHQLAEESGVPLQIKLEDKRATSLMSFRGKDYDKNIAGYAYLTKGKYEAKYLQGWTKEDTDSWKNAWVMPKNHVKRTVWRVLYSEYVAYGPIGPLAGLNPMTLTDQQFMNYEKLSNQRVVQWLDDLWKHIEDYLFVREHNQWCPQFTNMAKSIFYTHVRNSRISIPKGYRFT